MTRTASRLGLAGLSLGFIVGLAAATDAEAAPARDLAHQILDAAGVPGGLVVHVHCAGGDLTAALGAGKPYLVQGLSTNAEQVAAARVRLRDRDAYGRVSIARFDGRRLPYVDNLANLVVAEDLGQVPAEEAMRVLCPGGVLCTRQGEKWVRKVKPRPETLDEWTHYLHDPSNNAVAHDEVIGPPRRLQWAGSPRWARHHDRMASLSAAVSAGGRLFYILDEGPCDSILLPPEWRLIARDAFNGTVLWKREIGTWHTHLWPFKSGPAQLPRRLVAVGDVVYATLGLDTPVTAIDGATGKTLRTLDATRGAEEFLVTGGLVIAMCNPEPQRTGYSPETNSIGPARDRVAFEYAWKGKPRRLVAVDADSGRVRWEKKTPVTPLSLAADDDKILFHDGKQVVCLAREDGAEMWTGEPASKLSCPPGCFAPSTHKYLEEKGASPSALARSYGATLVVHDGVVLFTGGDGTMSGLSMADGKPLWQAKLPVSGHYSPEDILVVDGLAWCGDTAWGGKRGTGQYNGYDLQTGEIRRSLKCDTDVFFMHQRCYRSKATDRFLIPGRTGTEFIDPQSGHWLVHHWVRGGCLYGVLPANGLLYATPHSCACYMEAKLCGFNALASGPVHKVPDADLAAEARLGKGPAYDQPIRNPTRASQRSAASQSSKSKIRNGSDWPTYRHDIARSGRTDATVPADLATRWQADVGGNLSALTLADGKVFVVTVDTHTVHALDAESGKPAWRFTAGGRVDSPPTIHEGRVLFGSNDGYVYCLRSVDGRLIWRFRAAPTDRRLVAWEQVESAWPVPGNVLVHNGAACCVAGRNMFLDGGLRVIRLDPATGRLLSETVLNDRDPESGKSLQAFIERHNMPVGLPDVLSCDGENLYMRSQQLDLKGRRRHVAPTAIQPTETDGGHHLFSPIGFLDGSWWHRSYWVYGKGFEEGAGGWPKAGRIMPAGYLLAFDDDLVYGFGRKQDYYKWTTPVEYQLFAMAKEPIRLEPPKRRNPDKQAAKRRRRRGPRYKLDYKWTADAPMHVWAMAMAGRTLFFAGPPVVVDEEQAFKGPFQETMYRRLQRQSQALDGAEGGLLWAVSADDGTKRGEVKLDAVPAWDGMAVAYGRLFLSTADGKVLCLGGR